MPLLPENKSPLLSFPNHWGIFKTTLSCGLSILGLWDTYSRNHLEKHLSNVSATLLKCRLWYNRWADGAELCIPRKLAGGSVAAQWRPLIWTILLKKKVRFGEPKWLVWIPMANTGWDWGENWDLPAVKLSSLISCQLLKKKVPATEADLLPCNASCLEKMEMEMTGHKRGCGWCHHPRPHVLSYMRRLWQPWLEEKLCLQRHKGMGRLRKLFAKIASALGQACGPRLVDPCSKGWHFVWFTVYYCLGCRLCRFLSSEMVYSIKTRNCGSKKQLEDPKVRLFTAKFNGIKWNSFNKFFYKLYTSQYS